MKTGEHDGHNELNQEGRGKKWIEEEKEKAVTEVERGENVKKKKNGHMNKKW